MIDDEQIAARLTRLAQETAATRPSAELGSRVMLAIGQEGGDWLGLIQKPARRFLPWAAVAAVLAVVWATKSADLVEDELAVSYGAVELEW